MAAAVANAESEALQLWLGRLLILALPVIAVLLLAGPASASKPGSCKDHCGEKSGSCYCDKACLGYGDCCEDFPQECGGTGHEKCGYDDDCDYGEFCKLPYGSCDYHDAKGICTEKCDPHDCGYASDPVCGCDGNTYENSCKANCKGVQVDHYGECKSSGCPGGGGSSETAKAWILWSKHPSDCVECDQFNSSGGYVKLVSNKKDKHFEFVFENLGWKFKCDCSSHKEPIARAIGPRGNLQVTLSDPLPKHSQAKTDDDDAVCKATFDQPKKCDPYGASEDLHVRVDCSERVDAFHLLFLR
jgi:hypothetical protein